MRISANMIRTLSYSEWGFLISPFTLAEIPRKRFYYYCSEKKLHENCKPHYTVEQFLNMLKCFRNQRKNLWNYLALIHSKLKTKPYSVNKSKLLYLLFFRYSKNYQTSANTSECIKHPTNTETHCPVITMTPSNTPPSEISLLPTISPVIYRAWHWVTASCWL